MASQKKINNTEIDILRLLIFIWNDKFKIILLIIFTTAITYLALEIKKPNPKYLVSVEIRPISSLFIESAYNTLNFYNTSNKDGPRNNYGDQGITNNEVNYNFKKIDNLFLNNLFVEKLEKMISSKQILKDENIIKRKDFGDQQSYENIIKKITSSIIILQPKMKNSFWKINFVTEDIEVSNKFLESIEKYTNYQVKWYLIELLEKYFIDLEKLKKFKIENTKKQIENNLTNYQITTERKIAFLTEQANIARKLKIRVNSAQSIITETKEGMVHTLIPETQYYMKGYEFIEEEIEMIRNRNDIKAFAQNLNELEKKLREIKSSNRIENIKTLLAETPIIKGNFSASKLSIKSIKEINKHDRTRILIITSMLSAFFGIAFVIFINIKNNRIKF